MSSTAGSITVDHCISWVTDTLPSQNKNFIRSPLFAIHKMKCFLEFWKVQRHDYCLSLEGDRDPEEPFELSVEFVIGVDVSSRWRTTVLSERAFIWGGVIPEASKTTDIDRREFLFRIVLLSHSAPKKEDKSVQTSAHLDSNFEIQSLSRDLSKLLEDSSSTDVELVCRGRTFAVHRSLLSARSDVFRAMLGSDMTEGKTGRVQIEDTEAGILQQFLLYLYKGKLEDQTVDTATELYKLGDKYAVEALKKQCVSFLAENLSQDNACGILSMADRHEDNDLKESAILYILDKRVPQDDNWLNFCQDHPVLANHVLNRFCALQEASSR